MINPEEILDHVAKALARLPQQYKTKEKIRNLITGFTGGSQDVETMFFDLLDGRTLANATGVTLDNIGSIVDIPRPIGTDDDEYRVLILEGIFRNKSNATPNILISIARSYFGDTSYLLYFEGAIASFSFNYGDTEEPTQLVVDSFFRTIQQSKAGGVKFTHLAYFDTDDEAFSFDGPDGGGFSSVLDPTEGGAFAKLLLPSTPTPLTSLFTEGGDPLVTEGGEYIILEET